MDSFLDVLVSRVGQLIGNPIIHVFVEGADGLVHRIDFFSLLVGYVKAEELLHGYHKFNTIERIKSELLEGGGFG